MSITTTQPLDERDNYPWLEDHDEAQAYQQEREVEQVEAHFTPSEPW